MSEVLQKKKISDEIYELKIKLTEVAEFARPGQYIMVKADDQSVRTPLFISGNDKRSVSVWVSTKTPEGKKIVKLRKGSKLPLVAGLYGQPFPVKEYGNVVWVAEEESLGMMLYLAEALKKYDNKLFMIATFKNKPFYEKKIKRIAHKHSLITQKNADNTKVLYELQNLFRKRHLQLFTMKDDVSLMKKMANISYLRAKTYSFINPAVGDDGIGISGKARILVKGEMKLIPIDGPFFDAHEINWESVHGIN